VATAASSSQIDLTWADNANNEEGFKIERCDGSGCSSFTLLTQTSANVTTVSDTGLTAGATYSYRVLAFNTAGGNSGYSNTAEATTSTVTPPPPPIAPSALTATAASSSQIDLGWADNSSDETGFEIERCQGASCADFVKILQTAADVRSYSDTGRTPNTTYQYRVRAVNGGGPSVYSNTAGTTTQATAVTYSHVGDLDASKTTSGPNWRTTITVTVHTADHAAVSGATVSGNWSGGTSGSASCTTTGSGTCTIMTGQMKRATQTSVTFSVANVSHSTLTYQPVDNHDPDGGDSNNGTTITVTAP
jgi:hypothetical protein